MRRGAGARWFARAFIVAAAVLASATGVWASQDGSARQQPQSGFVGEQVCTGCHTLPAWSATTHARVFAQPRTSHEERGCEACHGPGEKHAADPGDPASIRRFGRKSPASTDDQNAACLQCHEKGIRVTWQLGPHAGRASRATGRTSSR